MAADMRGAAGISDTAGAGPLDGVRVLDLTSVVMGPMATQILGDLGADVVTVESGRGDANRGMGPGPYRQLSGVSLNLLRNKRNVALDLKRPEGLAAMLRIAATCDVFVTNLRPGPLGRLGLGYAQVAAVRPDVIFCETHGFATGSPRANDPAYDDIVQAASGVLDASRRATGEPAMVPTLLADKVCGLVLAYAIIAALFHRERTGEGQHLEVPMVDSMTAFMLVEHGSGAISRPRTHEAGYQRILTPFRGPQRTADGWIVIFPYLESHWEALSQAAGSGEPVPGQPLAATARHSDPALTHATLAKILTTRTTAQWLRFCAHHHIPASEAADLDDLVDTLPEAEHPVAGRYKVIPPPVRFSRTPASVRRPAPLMGQHNREVLAEVGLDDEEIARLEASGVLRTRGSVDALHHKARRRGAAGPA